MMFGSMTQLCRHQLEAIKQQRRQWDFEARVGAFFESDSNWTSPSFTTGGTTHSSSQAGSTKGIGRIL